MDHELLTQVLEWVRSRYFGKYRGTVISTEDQTSRGRVKVRVPAVLGDLEIWAMPCVPYAGDSVGFYCLPKDGSGCWVEFEGGDPSFPICMGFFWADGELPGDADAAQKTWRTDAITVAIDDANQKVTVTAQDGASLEVGDEVVSARDGSKHTVSSSGVTSEVDGKKTELNNGSFNVNDGALEVT